MGYLDQVHKNNVNNESGLTKKQDKHSESDNFESKLEGAVNDSFNIVQAKKEDNTDIISKMSSAFNTDFSDVKLHTNSSSAESLGALAFTSGNNIHFAPGQFNTNTTSGQELIGHEFTHVVQQRQGRVQPTIQAKSLKINDDKKLENEADEMGKKIASGKSINLIITNSSNLPPNNGVKQFKFQKGKTVKLSNLFDPAEKEWIVLPANQVVEINLDKRNSNGLIICKYNGKEYYTNEKNIIADDLGIDNTKLEVQDDFATFSSILDTGKDIPDKLQEGIELQNLKEHSGDVWKGRLSDRKIQSEEDAKKFQSDTDLKLKLDFATAYVEGASNIVGFISVIYKIKSGKATVWDKFDAFAKGLNIAAASVKAADTAEKMINSDNTSPFWLDLSKKIGDGLIEAPKIILKIKESYEAYNSDKKDEVTKLKAFNSLMEALQSIVKIVKAVSDITGGYFSAAMNMIPVFGIAIKLGTLAGEGFKIAKLQKALPKMAKQKDNARSELQKWFGAKKDNEDKSLSNIFGETVFKKYKRGRAFFDALKDSYYRFEPGFIEEINTIKAPGNKDLGFNVDSLVNIHNDNFGGKMPNFLIQNSKESKNIDEMIALINHTKYNISINDIDLEEIENNPERIREINKKGMYDDSVEDFVEDLKASEDKIVLEKQMSKFPAWNSVPKKSKLTIKVKPKDWGILVKHIRNYQLADSLTEINKKRKAISIEEIIYSSIELGGEIATLTGVGALAGGIMKGTTAGLRTGRKAGIAAKQLFREQGWFGADPNRSKEGKKRHEYAPLAKAFLKNWMIQVNAMSLDEIKNDNLSRFKEVEDTLDAIGVSLFELQNKDVEEIPEFLVDAFAAR